MGDLKEDRSSYFEEGHPCKRCPELIARECTGEISECKEFEDYNMDNM